MDLFDRQIISYAIGASPNLELANASLRGALATLEEGQIPLVHSGQGFQYQHNSWRTLLASAGAVQSMSRKANCYDNAVIESWFSTVKSEEGERFESYAHAKEALFDYIEVFYNQRRRHSTLGHISPAEFERRAGYAA